MNALVRIVPKIGTQTRLGSTELGDLDRCDRLYWYKHVRRLVTLTPTKPRLFGSLAHVCLRYWYAQQMANPPAWFYATLWRDEMARVGRGHPDWIQDAEKLFDAYRAQFEVADKGWTVIAVEQEYSLPLDVLNESGAFDLFDPADIDRLYAAGEEPTVAVDVAWRRPDTIEHWMDYKTQAGTYGYSGYNKDYNKEPQLPSWNDDTTKYALAWQQQMYQWIARRLRDANGELIFPNLSSFIIQRILSSKPYTADRHTVPLAPHIVNEVPEVIIRQMIKRLDKREAIKRRLALGGIPVGSPWACDLYSGCDFNNVCRSYDFEGVLAARFGAEQ